MKWVADEDIEPPVVEVLRAAGHDVVAIYEAAAGVSDSDLLSRASAEGRILLTYDKDFGELVFRLGLASSGIVLIRLTTRDAMERAQHIRRVLPALEERAPGHFVVVSDSVMRTRAIPSP